MLNSMYGQARKTCWKKFFQAIPAQILILKTYENFCSVQNLKKESKEVIIFSENKKQKKTQFTKGGNKAKAYQVKQIRGILQIYDFGEEE